MRKHARQVLRHLLLLWAFVLLPAVVPAYAQSADPDVDSDPWEGFNRSMFWFNERLDDYVVAPAARGWDFVMPTFVQDSISNFFDNLNVPIVTVNALLQGKPTQAGVGLARFLVNTTMGFAGFFDPAASELGLEPVREDFGQTLGVWGLGPGPYMVLPFLGPSSPRDAVGLGVDGALAVYPWFIPAVYLYASRPVDLVNTRAGLLGPIADSRKSALDYYVFVRNAYVQYRQALVTDKASEEEAPGSVQEEDLYEILPGN
jgi:phospholipid-binding lipoprotein MlaA